jgi:hypothetical protein
VPAAAAITLRLAGDADAPALERLAGLSDVRAPIGPTLLAEVDGEPWAALPLSGGSPLANPFRPTTELRALLALRASDLDPEDPSLARQARGRLRPLARLRPSRPPAAARPAREEAA